MTGHVLGGPGRGNYGAARLKTGEVITGRSGGGLHAEEDLINQAGGIENISDLYTERAPCEFRCQGLLADEEGVPVTNVTWSYRWNGESLAETSAIRKESNGLLSQAVAGLDWGG